MKAIWAITDVGEKGYVTLKPVCVNPLTGDVEERKPPGKETEERIRLVLESVEEKLGTLDKDEYLRLLSEEFHPIDIDRVLDAE